MLSLPAEIKTVLTGLISIVLLTECKKPAYTFSTPVKNVHAEVSPVPIRKTVSYLALGDSYTIGHSVLPEQSFPYQLKEKLKPEGIAISDMKIIAHTGWTSDELLTAIANESLTKKFDFVTLLIGVNNQFRGYNTETYREEFVELLNTAIGFANGDRTKVFVISIPDWGMTPYGGYGTDPQISKQIDAFNLINKEETAKLYATYIDITEIYRQGAHADWLISVDKLHPSGQMYALWVQEMIPQLRQVFK